MSREVLPNRRASESIGFVRKGLSYRATLGYYPDGRLGEVFLEAGKAGTDVAIATRDSAIALSFALQHGASVHTMRDAFSRTDMGDAEGPLGTLLDLLTYGAADG